MIALFSFWCLFFKIYMLQGISWFSLWPHVFKKSISSRKPSWIFLYDYEIVCGFAPTVYKFFFTSPTSVTTSCQICSILSPKSLFLFKRLWTPINDFNHRKVVLDQMLKDHSTTSCWLIVSNKNIQNTSDRLFSEWKVWQRYFWLLKSGKTVHNRWCS